MKVFRKYDFIYFSDCLIDELSSHTPNKVTGCNSLIKGSNSNRKKQHHILQELNHGLPVPSCKCSMNDNGIKRHRAKLVSGNKVDSSDDVLEVVDSSTLAKCHDKRSDSLKENEINRPTGSPIISSSDCDNIDSLSPVVSTTEDHNVTYDCTDGLCKRSLSEAIPIPLYTEGRLKHAECQTHHEANNINQQINNENSFGKLDSSEMLNFTAESSTKTTPPDDKDDSLLLFVSLGRFSTT